MATNVALSDFTNVTLDRWLKKVTQLPNVKYWLWNNLKIENVVKHGGEAVTYVTMQTQIPESALQVVEGSANPSASVPAFDKGSLYMKKIVAPMRFTEETIDLNSGAEVLVKNLENISNGTLESYNMNREFQMHQDATGKLTDVVSVADHTITVSSARWLRKGMTLDAYHGATRDAYDLLISSVDYDANTIVVTDPHSDIASVNSDSDLIYFGSYVSSATITTTRECNGMETLINDADPVYGSIMALDRDTKPYAKAVVKYGTLAGTAEALTLPRMRSVVDSIDVNWGQDFPSLIYGPIGVYNSYAELVKNEHQPTLFMPAEAGWPESLAFIYNGKRMRVVSSRLAAPYTMFFINPAHYIKYVAADTGWDTLAGTFQKVSGFQMYERVYRGYQNFGVDAFKAHGRLNDISHTT